MRKREIQYRRLAKRIARDLFTCGGTGKRATHLRLYDGSAYLAGWAENPMASRIAYAIELSMRQRDAAERRAAP